MKKQKQEATGGGYRGSPTTTPPPAIASRQSQAETMLDIFASIGATHFDITHISLDGEKRGYRKARALVEVKQSMRYLIASAERRQNNVIVRPRVDGASCIQLDDLDYAKAKRVSSVSFLILETSPGNYQAWVAVKDAGMGLVSRLRKGAEADPSASGATRIAGSLNYKTKYGPEYPIVRMAGTRRGLIVTVAALEASGLLAPEQVADRLDHQACDTGRSAPQRWPSYTQCLARAPKSGSRPGQIRDSSADFTFCKIAISWGYGVEATAEKLMQESAKAKENGRKYALDTANRAVKSAMEYRAQQQARRFRA